MLGNVKLYGHTTQQACGHMPLLRPGEQAGSIPSII